MWFSAAKYPKDNHLLLKHFHLFHSQTAPCQLYEEEGVEYILNFNSDHNASLAQKRCAFVKQSV